MSEFSNAFAGYRCPAWQELPDIALYMDQVLSVLERAHAPLAEGEGESLTTAAMVNNYVKQGVLPPPEKKKYSKPQLSLLYIVGVVKKVFSILEIQNFFTLIAAEFPPERAHGLFCAEFERALGLAFSGGETAAADPESAAAGTALSPAAAAVRAACVSVAEKLLVLSILKEDAGKRAAKEKEPKEKEPRGKEPKEKEPKEKEPKDREKNGKK